MPRTTKNKQYIEQHTNIGRLLALPHLCGFYPGTCLTTEEKARKNLSQGNRREKLFPCLAHLLPSRKMKPDEFYYGMEML
jgi:hypothetical protein